MGLLLSSAKLFSSACFFYYSLSLLVSKHMTVEFERYGLSRYRGLVGWLQLAGSLGLLVGFYLPQLTASAALGLAVLMGLGVAVRVRARDSILEMFPAIFLLALNAGVFFFS